VPRSDLATVLLELTQRLSAGGSLEAALQAVTDASLDLLPGDHASIRLLDASRMQLLATARSGRGTGRISLALKVGEGLAGWVLENGIPARVDDVTKDPRFVSAGGQGFQIASMLIEPLVAGGKAIGVLSVSSPEKAAFGEPDELVARLLANCSVPPIERARLERLAMACELTLALHGSALLPQLRAEMERWNMSGMKVSLLAMDLDRFRRVNEIYGTTMGDRVLRIFADRVRATARVFDVLVRVRGDRFALIMVTTDPKQAEKTAELIRVRCESEAMEPLQGGLLTQSVSVGVAAWDGQESPEALIQHADEALTLAKSKGGNRVVVAPR